MLKSSKGKDIDENDVFEINTKFKSPLHRIKINTIQIKESKEEQQQTEDSVFEHRPYIIDAAIMRIMKSRKKLRHGELFNELFTQLRKAFRVDIEQMKKRVETLIEREYMERNGKEFDVYVYIA